MKCHPEKHPISSRKTLSRPGIRLHPGSQCPEFHLQSDGEADQVDDHFLVGQLDGQDGQGGEEQLKVLVDVVFLFAAQVDVAVELLAVLEGKPRQEH